MTDLARTTVIIAECPAGAPSPLDLELIALAGRLQGDLGLRPLAVTVGHDAVSTATRLAAETGIDAWAMPGPERYLGETWLGLLRKILPEAKPALICLGQTSTGLDLAPALAVALGAACVTGVEGVEIEAGAPVLIRPAWHGKLEARIRPLTPTTVITLMPGAIRDRAAAGPPDGPGGVEVRDEAPPPPRTRDLGIRDVGGGDFDLTQADVIVAAGRGIGAAKNLDLIERLAALFPRSAVAGSRPIIDAGWLEYPRQVGQTGATVTPRLYLACGISGARQHTMGMQGAGFIVAVSLDPNAAIFNLADVCVVEDLTRFLPDLIEVMESRRTADKS
jgi:electron transfer flavoprotein alpha subunit